MKGIGIMRVQHPLRVLRPPTQAHRAPVRGVEENSNCMPQNHQQEQRA